MPVACGSRRAPRGGIDPPGVSPDEGIDAVKKLYNKRRKLRAVFYYLLVKELKQEGAYT